ncbi:hypothetical protein RRG08_052742 [Elysia crispata]|uniref:Uncharacterized protein n=1 Tax=Elysia crispata TaxID=231223 RepID=A0AAE1EAZ1_9GAST|nr:hypothetical protein RRG08_052742 [Elysia crispata]
MPSGPDAFLGFMLNKARSSSFIVNLANVQGWDVSYTKQVASPTLFSPRHGKRVRVAVSSIGPAPSHPGHESTLRHHTVLT